MKRERTITWDDPMEIVRGAPGLTGLELMQKIGSGELPAPPITATLGMGMVEVSEGRAVFTLEPGEHLYNPIGVVHGGAAATLLDSVMGCAVHTKLPARVAYTTLELKVNYLRPLKVESGVVRAVGTVIHAGRTTALGQERSAHRSAGSRAGSRQHRGSGQVERVRTVVSRPRNHLAWSNGTPKVIENSPSEVVPVWVDAQ